MTSTAEPWVLAAAAVAAAALLASSFYIYKSVHSRFMSQIDERRSFERELAARRHELREFIAQPPSQKKLDDIIGEKRNRFTNIPNIAFHFADEQQIRNFYDDYFKEPTIASLVSEITGEIDAQIKGSVPQILESKIGVRDLSKWVSTIKLPDTSLNGMFLRYQRETIKSGQVTLGLEEVDIELTELQAFDETVDTLRKRFDLKLEEQLLTDQRKHLKQKAA